MAASKTPCKIAIVGTGWWGQGWHLPQCFRNPRCNIVAIVDASANPKSSLNPNLCSLEELGIKYNATIFSSVDDLLSSELDVDGVIVSTPHATHFEVGMKLLAQSKLHILMEKPFTTNIEQAKSLHTTFLETQSTVEGNFRRLFMVNHSANWRKQTELASNAIQNDRIGKVRHVTGFMGSALLWIFDDLNCKDWNEPKEGMVGNGFGWGQITHLLAWIFRVTRLVPSSVFCVLGKSDITGADIYNSAVITCSCGATISLSGTAAVPGNEHAKTASGGEPIGKLIDIKIFGDEGALLYGGNDHEKGSGRLEVRRRDSGGKVEILDEHFKFENCDDEGDGPESVQAFLAGCQGEDVFQGADVYVGLQTIQVVDAMYRSNQAGQPVPVL